MSLAMPWVVQKSSLKDSRALTSSGVKKPVDLFSFPLLASEPRLPFLKSTRPLKFSEDCFDAVFNLASDFSWADPFSWSLLPGSGAIKSSVPGEGEVEGAFCVSKSGLCVALSALPFCIWLDSRTFLRFDGRSVDVLCRDDRDVFGEAGDILRSPVVLSKALLFRPDVVLLDCSFCLAPFKGVIGVEGISNSDRFSSSESSGAFLRPGEVYCEDELPISC